VLLEAAAAFSARGLRKRGAAAMRKSPSLRVNQCKDRRRWARVWPSPLVCASGSSAINFMLGMALRTRRLLNQKTAKHNSAPAPTAPPIAGTIAPAGLAAATTSAVGYVGGSISTPVPGSGGDGGGDTGGNGFGTAAVTETGEAVMVTVACTPASFIALCNAVGDESP
jgi:hypothetical protein